jgi:hypothetical protein
LGILRFLKRKGKTVAKPLDEKIKAGKVAKDLKAGLSKEQVASRYAFLGTVPMLERALAYWIREKYLSRSDYTPDPPAEKHK